METGPNAGAGPGGPEPDDDDDVMRAGEDGTAGSPGAFLTDPTEGGGDDVAVAGEPPGRIGETEVIRTGVGGPGPGGVTTQDLDAGRGASGVGPDDQPTAED